MRKWLPFGLAVSLVMASCHHPSERVRAEPGVDAEALLRRTVSCWATGDITTFAGAFADDAEFVYTGGRFTKTELVRAFHDCQRQKRDVRVYFGQFVVEGDRFAFEYQFAATDRATGRRQAVGTGVIGELSDGRIARYHEFWDEGIALQQLAGTLPLDEGRVSPAPASLKMQADRIN